MGGRVVSPTRRPAVAGSAPRRLVAQDHLRASTKELLRSKQHAAASAARYQMSADLNGALKVPVVPTKDKRSLQASSRYDAPLEAGRMDLKLSRLAHVGQVGAVTCHRMTCRDVM